MAKKITSQDIAEADVFAPTRESATALLKVVRELEGSLLDISKTLKGDLSKNPLASFGDTKKFTQDAEAAKTVLTQLEKIQVQRIALETDEAKEIAATRLEIQEKNKVLKDEAILTSKTTGEYQKQQVRLNGLIKSYQELAFKGMENGKVAKGLAAEIQLLDGKFKAVDASSGRFQRNVGNYPQQLREMQKQLAGLEPGSKAFNDLAVKAGKLKDNINDAKDATKAFASESKTQTAKTLFTQIGSDLRDLDFKGAADKSRQFAAVLTSISFKEVIGGIKDFGSALLNIGKALLLNPFTLLIAALAAVAFIVYDVVKAFSSMEDAAKGVGDAIEKTGQRIEKLQKRYRDAVLDIKESTGFISKEAADAQRRQIERQEKLSQAGLEIQEKFNEARKKLAEDLDVDLEELDNGRASETYSGNITQLLRNKEFNKQIVLLEKSQKEEVKNFNKAFRAENEAEDVKIKAAKLEKDKEDKRKELNAAIEANKKIQQEIENHNRTLLELRRKFRDEEILLNDTNAERERDQTAERFIREIEDLEAKIIKKKTLSAKEKEINEAIVKNIEILKKRLTQELDKLQQELKPIETTLTTIEEVDTDFKAEEERQKKRDEDEKKRQQQQIDDIKTITDITLAEINKRDEARIKSLDREISQREKNIDRQARLAEQGLDNSLAFEKQKQAEAEVERRRLAEQQEKRQKRLAYFKAFTELLDENPNNAAIKALSQLVVAEAIAGFFKDGVEDFQGKGTGTSDSNIVAISRGESITTAKATDKYPGLASAMNSMDVEKWVSDNYSPSAIMLGKESSDPQTLMVLRQINATIRQKKETDIHWDGLERRIETTVKDGMKQTVVHIKRKPRI